MKKQKPVVNSSWPSAAMDADAATSSCSTHIRSFLTVSTMHGLRYLLEPRMAQRVFWAAALAVAQVGVAYLVAMVFVKWMREPVYVAFDTVSTPVWQLPFPAVTVCNMNQVRVVDFVVNA